MTASTPVETRLHGRRAVTLVALLMALALGAPTGAANAGNRGGCAAGEVGAVTVVVDFGALGGGVDIRCATGLSAASRGSDALSAAGFAWSPPISQPGFVCRLAGRPTADETISITGNASYQESCSGTPPKEAYWSYWKSSGDGAWEYSSSGVTASRVTLGGFEGWSFVTGNQSPPGVSPVSASQAPPPPAVTVAPPPVSSPNAPPTGSAQPPASRPTATSSTAASSTAASSNAPSTAAPSTAVAAPGATVDPPTTTVAPSEPEATQTSASASSPSATSLSHTLTTRPSVSPAIVAADQALSGASNSSGSSLGFWLFASGVFAVAGAVVAARRRSRRLPADAQHDDRQVDAQNHGHRQADQDG